MPQFGAVGFGTPNKNPQGQAPNALTPSTAVGTQQILPSPSIWGSCDGSSMWDNPDGFFYHEEFKDVQTLPGLPNQNGTYTYVTSTDSALNVAYTSTGNATVFIKPMLPVSPQSGVKLWFEVALGVQQSTAQEIFVGFATSTGLSSTLLASSTTLLSTAGLIGFWLHGDVPNNFDAVYQKPLNISSTSTTVITVLASTLTAAANNADPGNPVFVPSVPPGAISGNGAFIKLGVTVTRQFAYWFVNGTQVAKQALDSTFDTVDSYGTVLTFGTATANTDNAGVAFQRAAARFP
jgi:hypothetical protein